LTPPKASTRSYTVSSTEWAEDNKKNQPTKKQVKRDFNALERGKKDGEITIKNISPKTTAGKREIIDETFKDSAKFKGNIEGDIEE